MSMSVAGKARHVDEEDSQFPAYGPIEAGLGYFLFYVPVESFQAGFESPISASAAIRSDLKTR